MASNAAGPPRCALDFWGGHGAGQGHPVTARLGAGAKVPVVVGRIQRALIWQPDGEKPLAATELGLFAAALAVAGLAILLIMTLVPAEARGLTVTAVAIAVALSVGLRRPAETVLVFVSALVLSDHEPNQVADFLDREHFGSIWATPIVGRFVAAEAIVVLAICLSIVAFRRSSARASTTRIDRMMLTLSVLLGFAALLGLFGREPAEEWRFWFFDTRAALYLLMGVLLGRLLIVSARPNQIVQVLLWALAAVFAVTAARFSLTPTGYKTIGDTNVILVSELVFLASTFVLVGGVYAMKYSRTGLAVWALVSNFMTLIIFLSGRRTGLLLLAIAVVWLLLIARRSAPRIALALAIGIVVVFGLAGLVAPKPMSSAVLGIVETVRAGEVAFGTSAPASASNAPAPSSAPPATTAGIPSATPSTPPSAQSLGPTLSAPPISEAATIGTETRIGELRNVYRTMEERGGLVMGLGYGKLWRTYYPQPEDPFAVGPRSGLLGTSYRFNTHVPGLDYFQRFGFVGVALWVVWAFGLVRMLIRWPVSQTKTTAMALTGAALISISLWGDPRMFFVGGLLFGAVSVLELRSQQLMSPRQDTLEHGASALPG
jgi:hypothetical protein